MSEHETIEDIIHEFRDGGVTFATKLGAENVFYPHLSAAQCLDSLLKKYALRIEAALQRERVATDEGRNGIVKEGITDTIFELVDDARFALTNAYDITEKYEHDQFMDSEAEMKTYIDNCSSDIAEARMFINTVFSRLDDIKTSLV